MKIKSLAIIAVLVSAIFGFANIVKASCLDENFSQKTDAEKIQCLTSVISDLTAQIAQIQNQQQTPAPTPTAWCHTFNTYLYFGIQENMNGDVSALMAALIKDGEDPLLTCGGSGQYCTMNSQIVSALKQFQAKYGISQTGTTGPITRAKLNSLYGCPKPSCTDTDGGKDYFTKGTVTWTYNTGAGTTLKTDNLTDFCTESGSKNLFEYYCDGNVGTGKTVTCDNGCVDGACQKPPVPVASAVTVFRGANYQGDSQGYNVGSYTLAQMQAKGTLNNDISSVKVSAGYQVTFYDADNFLGAVIVKTADDSSLVNDSFNDMVSSMKVEAVSNIPPAQPTIKIISPNGDESLKIGDTPTITWSSTNYLFGSVDLQLCNGSVCADLTPNLVQNTGSYLWTILSSTPTGSNYTIEARIFPNGTGGSAITDFSDNTFSIVPVTVQPHITVTSPNGSETWYIGTKPTINYDISSDMPRAGVCIEAYAVDLYGIKTDLGGTMSVSNPIIVDLGTGTTVHSVNLLHGNYKVELDASWCAETNTGLIASDSSDNTFSILATAPAPVPAPSVDLRINNSIGPVSIISGAHITLTWWISNASSCSLTGVGQIQPPANGSMGVSNVTANTTYTLACTNSAGVSASKSVTVNVAATTYSLNVSANNGIVTKNPTQTFYNSGTQVTLTATANTGYYFLNWSGDVTGSTNPYPITMDSDKSVTANFAANTAACTDTDGGKDYFTGGTVVDNSSIAIAVFGSSLAARTFNDICYAADATHSVDRVYEYYCDATLGYSQGEYHNCPTGCSIDSTGRGRCNQTSSMAPENPQQNSLASISSALSAIAEEIKALLANQ